jgi:tetratricopeptide (TPR) repeat protein
MSQRFGNNHEQSIKPVSGADGLSKASSVRWLMVLILFVATGPVTAQSADPSSEGATGPLAKRGLVLPAALQAGPIVNALTNAQFDQAIAQANTALEQGKPRARTFYLRGIAQLALYKQSDSSKRLKEAGLSFMRAVIYFEHTQSSFIAPSLTEAGYVHAQLGQEDQARSLYEQAAARMAPDEDPAYFNYLKRRQGALSASQPNE